MLARVADSLYWIGRYLERAENVSRLLWVSCEVSVELEGLDEALAQNEWDTLAAAVSAAEPGFEFAPESGLATPYVDWLLLDESNPVSVRSSLRRARENARSIREALTREIFENLNESYRALENLARRRLRDPVKARSEVVSAHRGILTVLGSIENTLSRDEGWTFMKLGEAIERTQRTLLLLAARLPSLGLDSQGVDAPLFFARWRGLLRSVASLENFRSAHGARLEPRDVLHFLLLNTEAPRSVLCGLNRIRGYVNRLPGGMSDADRIFGRLHSTLTYDDEQILASDDLPAFCVGAVDQLALAHDALARQYFPL